VNGVARLPGKIYKNENSLFEPLGRLRIFGKFDREKRARSA
jgi:hypothetical protein